MNKRLMQAFALAAVLGTAACGGGDEGAGGTGDTTAVGGAATTPLPATDVGTTTPAVGDTTGMGAGTTTTTPPMGDTTGMGTDTGAAGTGTTP